jgi:glycosyltransferase involved in cell wall biosynthesis
MIKIFYSFPKLAPFVEKDLKIMGGKDQVATFEFNPKNKIFTPFVFFFQLLSITIHSLKQVVFVTQFAGYQSVIPTCIGKILGIKNFIILGGTDCNWLPSINYGNYNKKLLKWATEYSLANAYHLIPVNKELVECDYIYTENDFPKQGYKSFFPNIKTPFTVIPNGIDIEIYNLKKINRNPKSFITTCSVLHDSRRRLVKGIDLVLDLAKSNADYSITIAGGNFPEGFEIPSNVHTIPFIENDKLPDLYNDFQYYLQLSLTEGFPNALIEAMACGCVPIVSSVGAMPEIVGQTGRVLQKKNMADLDEITRSMVSEYTTEMVHNARRRAVKYDIRVREKLLLDLITNHLTNVTSP